MRSHRTISQERKLFAIFIFVVVEMLGMSSSGHVQSVTSFRNSVEAHSGEGEPGRPGETPLGTSFKVSIPVLALGRHGSPSTL